MLPERCAWHFRVACSAFWCNMPSGCLCVRRSMMLCVQEPTVWVAEGLLMYLEEDAVASLLDEAAGVLQCPLNIVSVHPAVA